MTAAIAPTSKVVLLEDSDFLDLEVQEYKSQDIGDGAVLYSFTGDSSQTRVGSDTPVFLALAEGEAAMGGNVELSRLQVGKGTRHSLLSGEEPLRLLATNHCDSGVRHASEG